MQAIKRNYLHVIFKDFAKTLSNFDPVFYLKDSSRKPKLLLAANANLFKYISKWVYQKFTAPGLFGPHTFWHRINTSGVKIGHVFKNNTFFLPSRESEKLA